MRNCLVIGGNSGIGKAFARLNDYYFRSIWTPWQDELDVRVIEECKSYVNMRGPFSHIVYSAGINKLRWIKHFSTGNPTSEIFDTNVVGLTNIVSQHLEFFPDARVSLVAISSDASDRPMRGSLAYCVSKAALDMCIKCMARELAPLWRVNGVAPGMVEGTSMTEYIDRTIPEFRGWTPEFAEAYEKASVPTGRRATLEEVAETILFVLTGPDQINGEIIKVNGGRT
jgi:NAD(P)-dependent dehydrogenase (short-subunit alcohol dehydrogenase family)